MKKRRILLWILLIPLLSCGSSPTADIRVLLAADMGTALQQVHDGMVSGAYVGVYFEFRELKCPPEAIEDYLNGRDSVALSYPAAGQAGTDPLKNTFTIDTSTLKMHAYYQVRMWIPSLDGSGPPYEGLADCPLYLAAEGGNQVHICLGVVDTYRTCPQPPWVAPGYFKGSCQISWGCDGT